MAASALLQTLCDQHDKMFVTTCLNKSVFPRQYSGAIKSYLEACLPAVPLPFALL